MNQIRRYICTLCLVACLVTCSWVFAGTSFPIEIKGLTGAALQNVQARLLVLQESSDNESKQQFIKNASDNIREALTPFGFFKPVIKTEISSLAIIFYVEPGPSVVISEVNVVLTGPGKDDPVLQKLIQHFPLKAQQIFSSEEYTKAKEQLFQVANNEGYVKAELEKKQIQINLKNDTAKITLQFNTGPRYYFGHISFAPSVYSPTFLERFVPEKENTPFSSDALLTLQQKLRTSRYFKQVDATADLSAPAPYVPVTIAVTAPKSERYDAGIGYGTFTGARLTLGTDFRRITHSGQRLTTQLRLSSVLSGLAVKYYIPGNDPLTDQYTLGANTQYFAPKNGTSFSETLSGSYVKTQEDWQRTTSLNYLTERYRVAGLNTHRSQVFYPSLNFSRIKADDKISPRFGNKMNFTVQGASQNILSKTNFFQAEIKGKAIFSPTQYSRVILRGDLGYTIVEDLKNLPLTLNYFAGGLGSVRGYPYSSIGPGKYLQVASAELQHKIKGNWNGAIFYDVGNASNTFNSNFLRGEGVGIIYTSIIGPVQLYFGRAMSKRTKPWSVEFSIGPDF